jgi:hypothetical protein
MASLYSTKVTTSGGRHGSIRSENGLLDVKLALPQALGGGPMRPILNNSSPAVMQPASRMHSFMRAGMPAAALLMTISTSAPGSTLVEMKQEASCWPPRLP